MPNPFRTRHCIRIVGSSSAGQPILLGGQSQAGSYVLRLEVEQRLVMPFGRFKGGKLIVVERERTCMSVRHWLRKEPLRSPDALCATSRARGTSGLTRFAS